MVAYKYGEFDENQIAVTKTNMRKQIYFLLLLVDPKTCGEYAGYDVNATFKNMMRKFSGFNELMMCPPEMVKVMSLIEAANMEYNKENYNFQTCRSLLFEAGNEVMKISEEV